MLAVKGRLSNEHWVKHLFHPDEDLYVSKIMEMIAPAALPGEDRAAPEPEQAADAGQALQAGSRHLDRDVREDVSVGLRRCLGIQPPDCTCATTLPGSIMCRTRGAARLPRRADRAHRLPTPRAHVHLWQASRELPRRALHPHAVPDPGGAHDHVVRRRDDRGAQHAHARRHADADSRRRRKSLPSTCSRCSSKACASWSSGSSRRAPKRTSERWNQAVEQTACRAGLLVSGDLEIAQKIIAAEPQLPGDLSRPGEDEGPAHVQRE